MLCHPLPVASQPEYGIICAIFMSASDRTVGCVCRVRRQVSRTWWVPALAALRNSTKARQAATDGLPRRSGPVACRRGPFHRDWLFVQLSGIAALGVSFRISCFKRRAWTGGRVRCPPFEPRNAWKHLLGESIHGFLLSNCQRERINTIQ